MNALIAIQVIFLLQKLFGVVTWSWWWVFLPVWGTAAICVLFILSVWGISKAVAL
ncbi:MAG: hypothetical protein AAF578_00395 [Pseudomonadota bacterium]